MAFRRKERIESHRQNIVGESDLAQHREDLFPAGKGPLVLSASFWFERLARIEKILENGPVKNKGILSHIAEVMANVHAGEGC